MIPRLWDPALGAPADAEGMAPSAPHAFRYEPELCSLAEDETLGAWRVRQAQATRIVTTPAETRGGAHTRSRLIHLVRRSRRPASR